MKKILAFVGIAFFVLPGLALGAVSYSRLPSGANITSPVSFDVSFDNVIDNPCPDFWSLWVVDENQTEQYVFSELYPDVYNAKGLASSTLINNFVFNLSTGYQAWNVLITCGNTEFGDFSAGVLDLEGDGTYKIFTIISASSNPVITFPTSTASSLVANVSSLISDPGLLTLLVLVVAVPFGFYVIKKLISIIPKR